MKKMNLFTLSTPLLAICIILGTTNAYNVDIGAVNGTLNKNNKTRYVIGTSGGATDNTDADKKTTKLDQDKNITKTGDIEPKTISHCDKLKNRYKPNPRTLYIHKKARNVVIWSSPREPSVATAALLATAIGYIGYTNVTTRIDNKTTCEFVSSLPSLQNLEGNEFDEIMIHVDANLTSLEFCPKLDEICAKIDVSCNGAGHRLQVMSTAVGLDVGLHARLSIHAANDSDCQDYDKWFFYTDNEKLQRCGFLQNITKNNGTNRVCVPILKSEDLSATTLEIPEIFCPLILKNRRNLINRLSTSTTSYLFYDYNLWQDRNDFPKVVDHASEITVSLADIDIFRQYAPRIRGIFRKFKPEPNDLRQVLDLSNTHGIEEAACAWADTNIEKLDAWTNTIDTYFWVQVHLCDDELLDDYKQALPVIYKYVNKAIEESWIKIETLKINCSDINIVSRQLTILTRSRRWQWLMGVATAGAGVAAGVDATAPTAAGIMGLPLMVYDVPPTRARLHDSASTSTGRLQPLAGALRKFFKQQNWKRIAIISEDSILAKDLTAHLVADGDIIPKKVTVSETTIEYVLTSLKDFQAKIFFVNARFDMANKIICEASRLEMTTPSFAWAVREWHPTARCAEDVKVHSVSYSWRGWFPFYPDNAGANKSLQDGLKSIEYKSGHMPPFVAPLADALLMMAQGLNAVLQRHPELRYDIHASDTTSKIARMLEGNISVAGATQLLRQKQHALVNPFVYVSTWQGNNSDLLAVWQIDEDDNIKEIQSIKKIDHPPQDGSSGCLTTQSGDPFIPNCHDGVLLCAVVVILLTPLALWAARRARLKRLKDRDHEILLRFLARCQKTASLLSNYLVDRSALELYDELGKGHFGRVRFGLLRLPNRAPASVAVKALLKDTSAAEEAEFLREASALASLKHKHIVKLVGVCATDGPPLLLMEHAFFGDLHRYLCERYHLAEMHERDPYMHDVDGEDAESQKVSPRELTRLAREAAEALDYLVNRKFVHRDVRAANCLVDARRSLKLADFGLARTVEKRANVDPAEKEMETDYKYICQRRGVFPVPWMAPECLEHGEFSYASDVWALGVMILEVCTLGAPPFGTWRPPRVLRYLRSGGRPLLPRDASYHTCEVTAMCWHPIPHERATARQVVEYLREHPTALRAALRPACPELSPSLATDSGFGERDEDVQPNEIAVSTL